MTAIAATGRRLTKCHGEGVTPARIQLAVLATKKIKAGSLAVSNSAGTCEPGKTATGLVCLGRSLDQYDNTDSLSPAPVATIEPGIYSWENGDGIDAGDIGLTAYVVDDQTVSKDGTGKSPAGIIVGLDDDGQVKVATSPAFAPSLLGSPGAYALQYRTVTLKAGATVGDKLGTNAGIGTGADTDNTSRVYPLGAIMPAGAMYAGHVIHQVTPFANPNSDTLSLEIGGTDADGIVSALDLLGSVAGYYDGTAGAQNIEGTRAAAVAGQQLTATLNPGATGKVSEQTAGEVKITVFFVDATDA